MGGKGGGRKKKKESREPDRVPSVSSPFLGKPLFSERGITKEAGAEKEKGEEECKPKKNVRVVETPSGGKITIENYYPAERLEKLSIDDGICMFSRNNPERQKGVLTTVSRLEGSNVICGVDEGKIVSYIAILHPSEAERWGKPSYPWLFELGAIEVSRNYRRTGLAGAMLGVAFDDHFYDDKIVFATGFTWHWDLEETGLDKLGYREVGAKLFSRYGFTEMSTDEPNVAMDSANLFLVRIGKDVSFERYHQFSRLLFTNEWEAMLRGF